MQVARCTPLPPTEVPSDMSALSRRPTPRPIRHHTLCSDSISLPSGRNGHIGLAYAKCLRRDLTWDPLLCEDCCYLFCKARDGNVNCREQFAARDILCDLLARVKAIARRRGLNGFVSNGTYILFFQPWMGRYMSLSSVRQLPYSSRRHRSRFYQ